VEARTCAFDAISRLNALSPQAVLKSGNAIITDLHSGALIIGQLGAAVQGFFCAKDGVIPAKVPSTQQEQMNMSATLIPTQF
jgi:hypothetical protein